MSILADYIEKKDYLNKYKFILIDCPPTWSILTSASLYASRYFVIPSKVDFYSSLGIKLLLRNIHKYLWDNGMYKKTGNQLDGIGVVFTMYSGLKLEQKRMETVKSNLAKDKDTLPFFTAHLRYMPSAATRFILYSDMRTNSKYITLLNGLEKIVDEMLIGIKKLEANGGLNNEIETK